jgi:tetratricopeptide (TPR) repeat protein
MDRSCSVRILLSFFVVSLLMVRGIPSGHADDPFAAKYRAYQAELAGGMASFDKKDFQSAIQHYSKAIEMSPFVATSFYQRGIALYKLGKYKEALEDFDKTIILDARMGTAFTYRGLCRMKTGEYQEALSDYRKALGFNPKDVSVHNNLALLYAAARDDKVQDKLKALEHGVRAAELSNEKNGEVLDTLALVYFVNGKIHETVETEKKALKLEPNNEKFKENLKSYEEQSNETK